MDNVTSLQGFDEEIIPVSEVNDLNRIQDILGKAVSKQVGNTAHILAFLFNSYSRQHYESGLCSFHFIIPLMILFFLLRFVFMVRSTGIRHTFRNALHLAFSPWPLFKGVKSKTALWFESQQWPALDSGSAPLAKRSHFDT